MANSLRYRGALLTLSDAATFEALDPSDVNDRFKADELNTLTEPGEDDEFDPAPLAGHLRMNRAGLAGAEILAMDELPDDVEV